MKNWQQNLTRTNSKRIPLWYTSADHKARGKLDAQETMELNKGRRNFMFSNPRIEEEDKY